MKSRESIKTICTNKKALRDYEVEERYEAGIVLKGTEVKSLREGRADLKDSYAVVKDGEVFLINAHISPYTHGNRFNLEPDRTRKLLLHRREIRRLIGKTQQKGYSLIPLRLYFKGGKAKVELALARGRKMIDKREELKRKAMEREMAKAVKGIRK